MLSRTIVRSTVAAVALCSFSAPALASSSEALLKRLHEKGILTDEEYATLLAQEQAEAQAVAVAASNAPAMAKAEGALDSNRMVTMTESGIGLNVGPATIKFSGSVNGFYVHDSPQTAGPTTTVVGGVANVGGNNTSSVRNGLLPGFLKVDVTSRQAGLDIGAHFGMYPGINSTAWGVLGANNGGQPTALATAGIDFRQTYLTVGGGFGEFKIGRDIGLFASEGILNDITLLSGGTPGSNVAPGNTTLGRIGVGYIYTDFQPQITYSSPNFGGAQVSLGIFQPLSSLTGPAQSNSNPGYQAKITYDAKLGGIGTRFWVSGLSQKHNSLGGVSYTGRGIDLGSKVTAGPVTLVGYYYDAKGLGTTVLNLFDTDSAGNPRKSHGFYGQAMATFGKVSVGGSYGESSLDYANAADALANPALLDTNSSWVGQVRYGLTSWVTLIGEYTASKAEAHNGNKAKSDTIALGGILFF